MRIASAIALGEIGGSESAVALERCAIYDQKEDVRKAAATALERLNAKARSAPPIASQVAPSNAMPAPPGDVHAVAVPRIAAAGPRATGTGRRAVARPGRPPASSQPPPPPTPVTAGPAGGGRQLA